MAVKSFEEEILSITVTAQESIFIAVTELKIA